MVNLFQGNASTQFHNNSMKYLNSKLPIIRLYFIVLYFLVQILASCTNRSYKKFYGTYENNDTIRFAFSVIKFYENNNYSFYSSTCFDHTQDSGKFTLNNDTLSFQSFNLYLSDSAEQKIKNLNKINFLRQSDKIIYIRYVKPLNKPSYFDTILIGQKKI
jgi:hypothetical protein